MIRSIADLEQYLPSLASFPNLMNLNLESCGLQSLPADMSTLKSLAILNLNNNIFEDLTNSLNTLPKLASLIVRIEDDNEANIILCKLKGLKFLNGSEITDEDRVENKTNLSIGKHITQKEIPLPPVVESPSQESVNLQKEETKKEEAPKENGKLLLPVIPKENQIIQDQVVQVKNEEILDVPNIDSINVNVSNLNDIIDAVGLLDKQINPYILKKVPALFNIIKIRDSLLSKLFNQAESYQSRTKSLLKSMEEQTHKIADLERENEKYMETIIKHSKQSAKKEITIKQCVSPKSPKSPDSPNRLTKKSIVHLNPLGIKQLKDIIEDIYAQKKKYDLKCIETKIAKETMEQYLYTYLNQKYGLKNLIIEWATLIINAVKAYSQEDIDVSLFAKILRNECDEDFESIQGQIKAATVNILKERLKKKYKSKSERDILDMMSTIMRTGMEEWLWMEIVSKMYSEENAAVLKDKINTYLEDSASMKSVGNKHLSRKEQAEMQSKGPSSYLIAFADFQKFLLDFQLKSHEIYLQKFMKVFKAVDEDKKGIINEDQFNELMNALKISDKDVIQEVLNAVDPFNCAKITFSDIVQELATVKSKNGKSLLEEFLTESNE